MASFDFIIDLLLSAFLFFRFLNYKVRRIILLLIFSKIYPEDLMRSHKKALRKLYKMCRYIEVRQSIIWPVMQKSVDTANAHRNRFGVRNKVNIAPLFPSLLRKSSLRASCLLIIWPLNTSGNGELTISAVYFILGSFSLLENPFSGWGDISLSVTSRTGV